MDVDLETIIDPNDVQSCILQKQIGCFNHWVGTLVSAKLKGSGYERFALVIYIVIG